jgi:hypothetical protein
VSFHPPGADESVQALEGRVGSGQSGLGVVGHDLSLSRLRGKRDGQDQASPRMRYMSRGAVKAHLGHVYAKLGVANRTELARLPGDRAP